ncbi:MAG: hypothetical protein HY093_04940 [Candidatus Liptonbacteria bacterium]|nr:hypothetical protein [Candidatus Liptonbacteria bacterium]
MRFEGFPTDNTEEQSEQIFPGEGIKVEKDNSAELEAKFQKALSEKLERQEKVLTDDELVNLIEGVGREVGLEGEVFEGDKNRPKVFYRVFRNNEAVSKLVAGEENAVRPFSFSMPGTKGEIPLSYGGNDPVVTRIIDTTGEWEDTGKFLKQGGEWNEAMNLDPAVLRKVSEGRVRVSDVYAQVGRENLEEGEVLEVTYIVDKERTEELKASGKLEVFADDAGFWKEIAKRAKHFVPVKGENSDLSRLNSKYLDYFKATMEVDPNLATDESTRKTLMEAKEEIVRFFESVKAVGEDDINWTIEKRQEVLDRLSGVVG